MKTFKTPLRISSVGILSYLVYLLIRRIPAVCEFIWAHRTLMEVFDRGAAAIFLLSIIVACITIFAHRKQLPNPDKQLRIITHVSAWLTLALVMWSLLVDNFLLVVGIYYFRMDFWVLALILIASAVSLWKVSSMPLGEDSLPQSLSTAVLFSAIISAVVLLMMAVSGVHALATGHVIMSGLGTFRYLSWIRAIIPAILLPAYAIHITPAEKRAKIREYLYRIIIWFAFILAIGIIVYKTLDAAFTYNAIFG